MSPSILPADYTDAEKALVEQVKKGEPWFYSTGKPELDDPANGADWGVERTIRAMVIYDLAVRDDSQIHAKGVDIRGAKIDGPLELDGAKIPHPLLLGHCFIGKPITLRNADALAVNFAGSHVAEIRADGLRTRGSVFLRNGFHATGEVRLLGAKIDGDLDCLGGTFENANGEALSADAATVDGSVLLSDGFHANGEVCLLGAKIGGQLDCSRGTFENAGGIALNADSATVYGSVFLSNGFQAKGTVRLAGAKIGGQLDCSGGIFDKANGTALNLERASVTATLLLRELRLPPTGAVNLGYSQVGELIDDEKSWPASGKLELDGFLYERLAAEAPWRARDRLRWLSLQPDFRPQPYEQLVRVLREIGHEREAREVAIAKQVQLRRHGGLGFRSRVWSLFLGFTIAHGYKGGRAFGLLILAWVIGTVMFYSADRRSVMVPSEKEAYVSYQSASKSLPPGYPSFQAWLYALDVFVPGIDLHQKSKWSLHERDPGDRWHWPWELGLVVYFVVCWLLTLIGVGAVTGLLRPK